MIFDGLITASAAGVLLIPMPPPTPFFHLYFRHPQPPCAINPSMFYEKTGMWVCTLKSKLARTHGRRPDPKPIHG